MYICVYVYTHIHTYIKCVYTQYIFLPGTLFSISRRQLNIFLSCRSAYKEFVMTGKAHDVLGKKRERQDTK